MESKSHPAGLKRPFRLAFTKLSPEMDQQKPLASVDYSGWVLDGDRIVGGRDQNTIVSQSIKNGKIFWAKPIEDAISAPPSILEKTLFVGLQNGKLLALDLMTGNRLWQQDLNSFPARSFNLHANALYVITATQTLYAINPHNGSILWLFDPGSADGVNIRSLTPPVVHEGKIYYGLASGELVAVHAESGALIWRKNPVPSIHGKFFDYVGQMKVVDQTLLFSRYDGVVAAIYLADKVGEVAWQNQSPLGLVTSSEFMNNSYYVGTLNGDVVEIDAHNGKTLWTSHLGVPISTMTMGSKTIFVSSNQGHVVAMDFQGKVQWSDHLHGSIVTPPLYDGNALMFSTGLKNLYSYRIH